MTVHQVEAVEGGDNPTIISEFQDILDKHSRIYKAERTDRMGLKEMKVQIDDRMTSVMVTKINSDTHVGHLGALAPGAATRGRKIRVLST